MYIHPDACHGKSCVDAHFAVSYRHMKRYIQETRYDVLTPEDIVDALSYDNGIKNSAVEFISINRNHADLDKYEVSCDVKLLSNLESPCELRYEHLGGEKFCASAYKYSNSCFKRIFINGHESEIIYNYYYENIDDEESNSSEEEAEKKGVDNGVSNIAKQNADKTCGATSCKRAHVPTNGVTGDGNENVKRRKAQNAIMEDKTVKLSKKETNVNIASECENGGVEDDEITWQISEGDGDSNGGTCCREAETGNTTVRTEESEGKEGEKECTGKGRSKGSKNKGETSTQKSGKKKKGAKKKSKSRRPKAETIEKRRAQFRKEMLKKHGVVRDIEVYDIRLLENNNEIMYPAEDDAGGVHEVRRDAIEEEVVGNDWLGMCLANSEAHENRKDEEDLVEEDGSDSDSDGGVNDFDAVNDVFGYVVENNESGSDEGKNCNVSGVVNNTEERRTARLLRGQRDYFDMLVMHIGRTTGVQVNYASEMHHWDRKLSIHSGTAFQDTEAELMADDADNVGTETDIRSRRARRATSPVSSRKVMTNETIGNDLQDIEAGQLRQTSSLHAEEIESDEVTEQTRHDKDVSGSRKHNPRLRWTYDKRDGVYTCAGCRMTYVRKALYDKHRSQCTVTKVEGDSLQRVLRIADNFINEERSIQWYTRHEENPKLALVAAPEAAEYRTVRTGWARRPKWGQAMSDSAINEFKPKIKLWFQVGAAEPAKKMSASRMLKLLQAMNPHRYDVPTENMIKQYVSTLVQEEKKNPSCRKGGCLRCSIEKKRSDLKLRTATTACSDTS